MRTEGSLQDPEKLTLQDTLRIVTRTSRIFERLGERSLKVFKERSKIFSRVRHDPVDVFFSNLLVILIKSTNTKRQMFTTIVTTKSCLEAFV